ncbi:MAG: glycogen/starch synthase, partial [Candidatus Omnitrophica bacterium]|nr:glycogen/starch synthase [Candidatus Omnitrophota bacterium]
MKIVICSSEVVPFAKTGGLADVAGALPIALENLKQEVIIVMPKYSCVNNSGLTIKSFKPGFSYANIGKNMKVYFVENDAYYSRPGLYGEKTGDYGDNLLRFSFYSQKTLDLLKLIDFKPDVIHCNDWQSALIPVYLKTKLNKDPFFKKTKTILTVHNLAYQGLFAKEQFSSLGLDESLFSINGFEFYGKINFLKAGIIFSDFVTTVSQGYAQEILTKEFGCGLEEVLKSRKDRLSGIINGLDYSAWDPKLDKQIFKNYDALDPKGKKNNKGELQKLCKLTVKDDIPLFGFVGRLAEQKGIDLLSDIIQNMANMNMQMVILGTGDLKYHNLLEDVAKKIPQLFSLHLKFDDALARRIYAGCDMFLMPSRYEPCGLGQMISFKYGTVPVVYKTGGLADTVIDYNSDAKNGNGFVFSSYSKDKFLDAMKRGMSLYSNKTNW